MSSKKGGEGFKKKTGFFLSIIFQKSLKTGRTDKKDLTASGLFHFLDILHDALPTGTGTRISLHCFATDLIDQGEIDAQTIEKFDGQFGCFTLRGHSYTTNIEDDRRFLFRNWKFRSGHFFIRRPIPINGSLKLFDFIKLNRDFRIFKASSSQTLKPLSSIDAQWADFSAETTGRAEKETILNSCL